MKRSRIAHCTSLMQSTPEARRPLWHDSWRQILLIAFLAIAVFANSLANQFVNDDDPVILSNEAVHRLDIERIFLQPSMWASSRSGFRPLAILSLAVDFATSGRNPWSYHLVNVLLHAAVTTLVYIVLRALGAPRSVTFASALLFAVQPIHSEAVASVSAGRFELLVTLFVLLGLVSDIGSYGERPRRRALVRHGLTASAFLAALLSKETGVALLAVLLATDFLFRSQ
ncbi:MAG TPA: hypothetical protein VL403_06535, partial [Candidatus Kryptonia bacterium]|nr:hypothetical protein [Candidatus Kryptonia bacterium]